MSSTPTNPTTTKEPTKRGRKPKADGNAAVLAQVMADLAEMKGVFANSHFRKGCSHLSFHIAQQAARDAENNRLTAELASLRGMQTAPSQQQAEPSGENTRQCELLSHKKPEYILFPAPGPQNTPTHNTNNENPDENQQIMTPLNESDFSQRRRTLEDLVNRRGSQSIPQTPTADKAASKTLSTRTPIPKPTGQMGKSFNLCIEMKLSKSTKGLEIYKSLVVRCFL